MPKIKPFIPHVTLVRIKTIQNTEVFKKKLIEYENRELGTLETTMHLINSNLSPSGAEYKYIKRFEL